MWKSRWPSWAFHSNEPYGFCGHKATLKCASALVTVCPWYVNWCPRTWISTSPPFREFCEQKDFGLNLLWLSFRFKNCGLWTLSCDFVPHNYETLKWLSLLPTLMQKSFWWWQCSVRYIISLSPHLHTPPPFFLSLISLMASVDVKHHVYLLPY